MKSRALTIVFAVLLVSGAAALICILGLKFLNHERRQNADIEKLQIESWNQSNVQETDVKQYEYLRGKTEEDIHMSIKK